MEFHRAMQQWLVDLRRLARSAARRRNSRVGDASSAVARALGASRTCAIEERDGRIEIRFEPREPDGGDWQLTCVFRSGDAAPLLTPAEGDVAAGLCQGRTLAQIASLRGVSINTVKTQVRQIFRKLDVDTRVALVRRLCP